MWIWRFIQQSYLMPPKRSVTTDKNKTADETNKLKSKSTEKQTSLMGNVVEEPERKKKGKQHKAGDKISGKSSAHRWKMGSGKLPSDVKIASWNVNGIRSVIEKGDLAKYLKSFNPDILCLNETKIDEKTYDLKPPKIEEGYHTYWNFCKISSGYSGVAVFSKVQPISVVEDLPQPDHSQEGRVMTLEYEKFYLITSYIPNAGQALDRLDYRTKEYDVDMQNYLESLRKKKPVIWCGDLNVVHQEIDIARPKGNQRTAGFTIEERTSFSKFLNNGWIDTFRHLYPTLVKYSWWSMRTGGRAKNIGWRLDYFVVNKEFMNHVKDSRINNDVYGSDHCPIELILKL